VKKGFTLLELVVVIIILGILATLGIGQYLTMVERSRGAEARSIMGQIRNAAAAHYLEYGTVAAAAPIPAFDDTRAGIGTTANGQVPGAACGSTHYFRYAVTAVAATGFTATATRCIAGGKNPNLNAAAGLTLILTSNLGGGTDTWTGTGGY
jgi:prepilin-type N-terminal cleavage/methylation domain-containing protein